MSLARHKSQRVNAASIPPACEVCREEPVTTLVADFIFACDVCAKRISAVLWHEREERALTAEVSLLNSKCDFTTMNENASLEMQKVK
jgi:hypothetical protein